LGRQTAHVGLELLNREIDRRNVHRQQSMRQGRDTG